MAPTSDMPAYPNWMRLNPFIDEAIKRDLGAQRDFLLHLLWLATLVVAFGVVLEGIEHFTRHPKYRLDPRTGKAVIRWTLIAIRSSVITAGWALVAIGVVGEFVFENLVSGAEERVQTFNNTLIEISRREAAFANESAAMAIVYASRLDREAQKFRAQAREAERRIGELAEGSRLELKRLAKPRTLGNNDEMKRLHLELVKYSGTTFTLYTYPNGEAIDFALEIYNMLTVAGWKVIPWPGGIMDKFGINYGDRNMINGGGGQWPALLALSRVMERAGIITNGLLGQEHASPVTPVQIVIGQKK